ncbi:MAG: hypothetical protein ACE5DN_01070 [Flavobacteriales bacterium]
MKITKRQGVYIPLLMLLTACSAGVQKDLSTGLNVVNKNLTYEKSYISNNGEVLNSSAVSIGSKLKLMLEGVDGFKVENGKAFPGCSIVVTDKDGNNIMEYEDLFEQYNETGANAQDVTVLNSSLTIGDPMQAEQNYKWTTRFWDKKGEGEIITNIELDVTE